VIRRIVATAARALVGLAVLLLILAGTGLGLLETDWAKDRIRQLIVREAAQYLSATLTIGRLEGSILRGIRLGDVRLSRDQHPLASIDEIALSYSLRELVQSGTTIRRVRLTHPRFTLARQPDGRWDIAALVKRERREGQQAGPGRRITIEAIEIVEGRVQLRDPLELGAAHVPTDFDALQATFAFTYSPVRWRLDFTNASWVGRAPELSMSRLMGALGSGPNGWSFDKLSVETRRSKFVMSGQVLRGDRATELDLLVHAARFAFQEWSGVLHGLKNIAVDASFDARLKGPLSTLVTDLQLDGTGGSVTGRVTLDTNVPGWHGAGALEVGRLNLARWLNTAERPSDITGHVTFDLALDLGGHFPRGSYAFDGPHAMYMQYAADNVRARGRITASAALVDRATARAYGAAVVARDSSISIDSPFRYRFQGTVTQIDLRRVPATVPVPRVESLLTFDYDVAGRFARPFIAGRATFARSTFLGASINGGATGSIDTSEDPISFSGDGEIANVSLTRFGEGLEVGWLQDPRYSGTIAGRFHVDGRGADRATLAIAARGHLARGDLFRGMLTDADVSLTLDRGTLGASYTGAFARIDPSVPFADGRWQASLTGTGTMSATVPDLLTGNPTIDDYAIAGSLALQSSTIHGLVVDRARLAASLQQGQLSVSSLDCAGPTIEAHGAGTLAFDEQQASSFDYVVASADLGGLQPITGLQATGLARTTGRLTGPWRDLRLSGDGSIAGFDAFSVQALDIDGHYDVTLPSDDVRSAGARFDGHATLLRILDQPVQETSGSVTLDSQRLRIDLRVLQSGQRSGTISGAMRLRLDDRAIDISELTVGLGGKSWQLQPGASSSLPDAPNTRAVTVSWTENSVSATPAVFVGGNGDERLTVSGDWKSDGSGRFRISATHVFLDTLQAAFQGPVRYGGVLDLEATLRGTRNRPVLTGTFSVTSGRIERVNFQKLEGRVDFADRVFAVDLSLQQSPGASITAVGSVPMALLDRSLPDQPIDVSIRSSGINLGLLEGLTGAIRGVTGQLLADVRVAGTSHEPAFTGAISIDGARFEVAATGAKYKNGKVGLTLTADRVHVEVFHLEDSGGRPLEVKGSLGTRELRVGDLEIEIGARRFEVLRNDLGRLAVDGNLHVRGRFEAPQLTGQLTIVSGDLKVDQILERALFQPYSTEETAITTAEGPRAALVFNPWQLLALNLTLHVPNTLRLTGDNVQVTTGTPLGLSDINLRVAGDLYVYKDPRDQIYVSGSFDTMSGTYAFQGRRFDVDPSSSIVFRGDSSPELYVGVTRTISGVQTRVMILGPMRQPELRLSSVPPLEASDILSLIVFNTSANDLSASQQQQLAVRAGVLAAGFLATPLVSAISSQIGLETLEIEPGSDFAGDFGAKLTVGQEVAPGLVARFSRQFGSEPFDEATVEYYLSRIIRLRATFSDAQALNARQPFRRVERAGIDLLFFFSF